MATLTLFSMIDIKMLEVYLKTIATIFLHLARLRTVYEATKKVSNS